MSAKIKIIIISLSGFIVLLPGCVSQGSYDMVVKQRDELAKENLALADELKQSKNTKHVVNKDLDAAKQRLHFMKNW